MVTNRRLAGGLSILLIVLLVIIIASLLFIFIPQKTGENQNSNNSSNSNQMPNPASVNCENQGYNLTIRADAQGNQYGVCIFPDGSECEEWAYYRGECKMGDSLK